MLQTAISIGFHLAPSHWLRLASWKSKLLWNCPSSNGSETSKTKTRSSVFNFQVFNQQISSTSVSTLFPLFSKPFFDRSNGFNQCVIYSLTVCVRSELMTDIQNDGHPSQGPLGGWLLGTQLRHKDEVLPGNYIKHIHLEINVVYIS